jgi:hypothetical protein
MATAVIERLAEFPESLPVNLPCLLRASIVIPGKLVAKNLNGFGYRLVFILLLFLPDNALTINQVAQVDDQGRLQPVDLRDQAFERL